MNKFERFTKSIDPKEKVLTGDKSKIIFFLSIWFHIAVFNPKDETENPGQNQKASLSLYHKFFDELVMDMKEYRSFINPNELTEIDVTVKDIVMATVSHSIPD